MPRIRQLKTVSKRNERYIRQTDKQHDTHEGDVPRLEVVAVDWDCTLESDGRELKRTGGTYNPSPEQSNS